MMTDKELDQADYIEKHGGDAPPAPTPTEEEIEREIPLAHEWLDEGSGKLTDLARILATVRAEGLAAGQCCDPEAHEKIYQQGYADAIGIGHPPQPLGLGR